ncbi:MAG: protein-glutamate O-methyltransferase CheR [Gammaproteobacteria bacterium]|nr:protein-glutamate O-methyltransferase CheR [Gammaproteobacteria bacterium]MBQ0840513.1 protein-glutamate O-methyltransferase CheR [Gammaproteobacteria bacterium]
MKTLSNREFSLYKTFIFDIAGIDLKENKKTLVSSRLQKRLVHYSLNSFGEYYDLLNADQSGEEKQIVVDLLTTNETYFFREPAHFDFLTELLSSRKAGGHFRIWSGASSSGQEAYSMAMILADKLGQVDWEVVGTDLSTRVLATARTGLYSLMRTEGIPPAYLRRFCLKGSGPHEGELLIIPELRARVTFSHVNLNAELPDLGQFDVIFLRNVMIYFNDETKKEIVKRILAKLKPGGYFIVGHSESLKGLSDNVVAIKPTIYQKQ